MKTRSLWRGTRAELDHGLTIRRYNGEINAPDWVSLYTRILVLFRFSLVYLFFLREVCRLGSCHYLPALKPALLVLEFPVLLATSFMSQTRSKNPPILSNGMASKAFLK